MTINSTPCVYFIPNKEGNKKRIPITIDDDSDSQKTSEEASSSDKESVPNASVHVDVDVTLTKVIINHMISYIWYPCAGHALRVHAEVEFCAEISRVRTTCCATQANLTTATSCL